MDIDYEKIVSSKVCRICLKPVQIGRSVFDGDPSFCDMLRDLTGCRVHPYDMLPNILCNFCAESLDSLNQFIKLCRDSEERIQHIIEQGPPMDIKLESTVEEKPLEVKTERSVESSEDESYRDDTEDDKEISPDESGELKGRVKCKICNIVVMNNSALIVHLRRHTGERPYICDLCDRRFSQKGTLVQHMQRLHMKCKLSRFTCEICGKQTNSRNDLKIHIRVHTKEKPHKCSICSVGFAQTGTLMHHMRLHTGERPFTCHICSKSFIANNALVRHMTAHSDERQFKCHMCDKTFKAKSSLKQHFLLHSAEMPYSCSECGKPCRTASNMRLHMKAMHSELSGNCEECNKQFSNLPEHMKIHSGETPYACLFCDKKFAQKRSWTHHMNKHKNATKFKCPVEECNKGFPDSYKLEYHRLKCHSESAPFPCKLCPRKFYRSSDFKKHIKTCLIKTGSSTDTDMITKVKSIKNESNISRIRSTM